MHTSDKRCRKSVYQEIYGKHEKIKVCLNGDVKSVITQMVNIVTKPSLPKYLNRYLVHTCCFRQKTANVYIQIQNI